MNEIVKHTITCYCENQIELEVPAVIDLDQQAEVADQIINGEYLTTVCDRCGKELKPEFELYFASAEENLKMHFLAELQREAFYKGEIESGDETELVIGFKELVDYFMARRYGLDRFALEALKLRILQRAPKSDGVEIYLTSLDGEELLFNIFGLREDEVGQIKVPLSSYRAIEERRDELKDEEPYSALFKGPYLSINAVSFEEDAE